MSRVRVTYRKSGIGYPADQRATLRALGLRRVRQTVEHDLTPAISGMIFKVRHLVSVDGLPADTPAGVAAMSSSNGEAS